jgi:hypothetical protein
LSVVRGLLHGGIEHREERSEDRGYTRHLWRRRTVGPASVPAKGSN